MCRERFPWGSSRVSYSVQGLRHECDEKFVVTLIRSSRSHEAMTMVVAPERYAMLLDMINTHTARRFKQGRAAYDQSLKYLECLIRECGGAISQTRGI